MPRDLQPHGRFAGALFAEDDRRGRLGRVAVDLVPGGVIGAVDAVLLEDRIGLRIFLRKRIARDAVMLEKGLDFHGVISELQAIRRENPRFGGKFPFQYSFLPLRGLFGHSREKRPARRADTIRTMILLIDNYDSFVHNLARYFCRLGEADAPVVRNDAITVDEIDGPRAGGDRPLAGTLHAE